MSQQSSSSSVPAPLSNPFHQQVTERLTRDNFLLCKAQVLPPIRGARLMGYLDGSCATPPEELEVQKADKSGTEKVLNPAYDVWVSQDQQVLGFVLGSLSREVLARVVDLTTAASLWKAIMEMYSSQSRARVIQLRTQLANTKKGEMTATAYFTKMKGIADEMAAAGKKVDEDDLVSMILAGLDAEYKPFVSAITATTRANQPLTLSDLFAQLLVAEGRLEVQSHGGYTANFPGKGGCGSSTRGGRSGRGGYDDRGGRSNFSSNHQPRQGSGGHQGASGNHQGGGQNKYSDGKPICQVCRKEGHEAFRCWKRFNRNFQTPEKTVNSASTSYGVDTNWYSDTGATDHITSELNKLTVHDRYTGTDQVHTANGSGSTNGESSSARQE